MAKSVELTPGIKALVERHGAADGTLVGASAMNHMGKLSNSDPSEAVWTKGDEFTVPSGDEIDKTVFVTKFLGRDHPAVCVSLDSGEAKVLYLSTLRKRITVYEQAPDGSYIPKTVNGARIVHSAIIDADNAVSKEVVKLPTAVDVLKYIAGKKFKVVDVLGPFQTARYAQITNEYGQRVNTIIGLRSTTIPVFEQI